MGLVIGAEACRVRVQAPVQEPCRSGTGVGGTVQEPVRSGGGGGRRSPRRSGGRGRTAGAGAGTAVGGGRTGGRGQVGGRPARRARLRPVGERHRCHGRGTIAAARPAPGRGRGGRGTSRCRPPRRRRRRASSPRRRHRETTPPTPTMPAAGKAARQSCTARTATGRMAGPERPPPPGARAQTVATPVHVDGHAQHRVHEDERLGSRLQRGAGDSRRCQRRSGSASPTAADLHAADAATARAVACAEWANIRLRSSTLGQLTLTSTATMPGVPASMAAAWAYSSAVRPQILATTGRRVR